MTWRLEGRGGAALLGAGAGVAAGWEHYRWDVELLIRHLRGRWIGRDSERENGKLGFGDLDRGRRWEISLERSREGD